MSSFTDTTLDRMARYLQLASLFRNKIITGDWPVGGRIPNVADLAVDFEVARGTIREALGVLEDEGLIERFRAKGSFVRRTPKERSAHRLAIYWASLISAHEGADIEVLEQRDLDELPAFAAGEGEPADHYTMMRRVHARDGHPYLAARFVLDSELFRQGPPERFRHEATLPILHEIAGKRIARANQIMTLGSADREMAALLELPLNAPVAHVVRRAIDTSGKLIYVGEGIYRGDAVRLEIALI